MPFIEEILRYGSVSIVGMQKNTGKTETLNYILSRLASERKTVGVTSIGIDGETTDQVTRTAKPEITLTEGTFFATSALHYAARRLVSEVVAMPQVRTSLGEVVVARVVQGGKILLSGAADNVGTLRCIRSMQAAGAGTILVDGALNRMSLASPAVTEALILATGAALSANIPTLTRQTAYQCRLIRLPRYEGAFRENFESLAKGICVVAPDEKPTIPEVESVVSVREIDPHWVVDGTELYVSGAVTQRFLELLTGYRVQLVVNDFTRIFANALAFDRFIQRGGMVSVLRRTRLLGITVNPTSPSGVVLDSDRLRDALTQAAECPVYNVKEL